MSERGNLQLSRHIKDLWPEDSELFIVGELVDRLYTSPAWDAVQSVIDREVRLLDDELDSDKEFTQAQYAYKHGRRSALRIPQEAARAILGKAAERKARAEAEAKTQLEAAEPVSGRQ